ncbi:hypothetical protein [Paenibacillus piri]|uniref:Uncharacterized protein n=1 Tax=Paenibacillus piri TaxID=2547395 RepID=A0A4R5KJW7_9BACL|nr:hypothetical protein [Paenibacillus piri]TDF95823.1 hypothetical protein E1757_19000 [Paenibacillus piri]
MKVSLKKILFIIVCAELMIFYWAYLDIHKPERIVYKNNEREQPVPEIAPPAETVRADLKKAL